jgi:hypothetical protein
MNEYQRMSNAERMNFIEISDTCRNIAKRFEWEAFLNSLKGKFAECLLKQLIYTDNYGEFLLKTLYFEFSEFNFIQCEDFVPIGRPEDVGLSIDKLLIRAFAIQVDMTAQFYVNDNDEAIKILPCRFRNLFALYHIGDISHAGKTLGYLCISKDDGTICIYNPNSTTPHKIITEIGKLFDFRNITQIGICCATQSAEFREILAIN